MGCGASKNKIHVVGASATNIRDNSAKGGSRKSNKTEETTEVKDSRWAKKRTDSLFGSRDSLTGTSQRGGSATSKFSKHSMDSGFGADDSKIISENSDPNVVKQIEDDFNTPRNADNLILVGQPVTQRRSAKERDRIAEESVMASLRDEGLITRPMSRAAGGVRFDIVADENKEDPFKSIRPPPRLAKLEKRKKKKRTFTEAEINAKLEKAKLRREKLEQQRLHTIKQVAHQSDVQDALNNFAQSQMQKDDTLKTKEEIAAENREKKLRALQEKLMEKKKHAEEVRKRKNLTLAPIPSNSPPSSAGSRKFRETDSIIASGSMEVR